jgi:hypothetical protein
MGPAYRMPMIAHERSLPVVLSEEVLSQDEATALTRFYVDVISFNFCLDRVQEVLMQRKEDRAEKRLEREYSRAKMKAEKLLTRNLENPTLYDLAIAVCRKQLPKDALMRLELGEIERNVNEES